MEYSISIIQNNIVFGKIEGTIEKGERLDFIKTIRTACEDAGSTKVIIDLNDSAANTHHVEDFNFGSFVSNFMAEISIAVVSEEFGRSKFVTDVATARGHNTRMFSSKEDALNWLKNFQ